jgi:hypothetical protein
MGLDGSFTFFSALIQIIVMALYTYSGTRLAVLMQPLTVEGRSNVVGVSTSLAILTSALVVPAVSVLVEAWLFIHALAWTLRLVRVFVSVMVILLVIISIRKILRKG